MMDVRIRRIALTDVPALAEITMEVQQVHHRLAPDFFTEVPNEASEYQSYIAAYLERGTGCIAEIDGQTVGGARYEIRQATTSLFLKQHISLHIDEIGVHSAFRGRGIGRQLMHHVMTDAKEQQARLITLNVFRFNDDAIRFYEKLGFTCRNMTMQIIPDGDEPHSMAMPQR